MWWKALLIYIGAVLILPLIAPRRGKGDYISDVLSILGYTVFIFVVIIFCAIFKL